MSKRNRRSSATALLLAFVATASIVNLISCGGGTPELSRLTVIYSGDIEGFLKNCGCSGGQVGGEKRKARLIHMERADAVKPRPTDRERPAEVVVLDIGNFANNQSEVWELYSQGVVRSMTYQDYDMVGLGHHELRYSQEDLWELIGETGMPFTAANLRFTAPKTGGDMSSELNGLLEKFRIIEFASGYRVGVIHVVDTNLDQEVKDANGVVLDDASEIAAAILRDNRSKAHMWILTAASTAENGIDSSKIAALTELTLVIGFLGNNPLEEPRATEVLYPFYLSKPYSKAKSVGEATLSFSTHGMDRFVIDAKHMLLNSNIKPDERTQAIIDELQPRLEDLELESTRERLQSMDPPPHYVGSEDCMMCHQDIYDFMQYTRHVNAYESLVEAGQERSAACLPCHVTGHGTTSGWNIIHNQEEFRGVTCENCHGPGSYHAEAMYAMQEQRDDYEFPEDFSEDGRNALGLRDVDVETCRTCHDQENSVEFSYRTYYPKIDHT
ncbi:MAG TPA: hypothetical protein ENO21_04980, partial [Firmicutes bacterium]|nr:hypothetical protein [Bacillota bacterium]